MPHARCGGAFAEAGTERRTDRQTKEHTRWRYEPYLLAGLTRFERVIDRAGDSSLPCEQGAAEAHVVSRVSDAELGQQQLPGWLLHQESVSPTPSFSRPRRQWQPLKGYLWPRMLYSLVFRRPEPNNEQKAASAEPRRTCSRLAEYSSGCFSSDSGFLPEVECVAFKRYSEFIVFSRRLPTVTQMM